MIIKRLVREEHPDGPAAQVDLIGVESFEYSDSSGSPRLIDRLIVTASAVTLLSYDYAARRHDYVATLRSLETIERVSLRESIAEIQRHLEPPKKYQPLLGNGNLELQIADEAC